MSKEGSLGTNAAELVFVFQVCYLREFSGNQAVVEQLKLKP